MAMPAIPLGAIGLFLVAVATQVLGAALLPRTQGFTDATWTFLCLASYVFSLWLVALLIRQGVALNIIVPLMAAAIPLATIAVAYFGYGQLVSLPKLGLLVGACCAIGVAGAMS